MVDNLNAEKFRQLTTASLIDVYHNEEVLWNANLNASEEEKERAWARLSSIFNLAAGFNC